MPAATTKKNAIPVFPIGVSLMIASPLINALPELLRNPEIVAKLRNLAAGGDETGPTRIGDPSAAG
jgi:hypothetical protein